MNRPERAVLRRGIREYDGDCYDWMTDQMATPRVPASPPRKRLRSSNPDEVEVNIASIGTDAVSAALSFLHPVELCRVEMTAKCLQRAVEWAWINIHERNKGAVNGCILGDGETARSRVLKRERGPPMFNLSHHILLIDPPYRYYDDHRIANPKTLMDFLMFRHGFLLESWAKGLIPAAERPWRLYWELGERSIPVSCMCNRANATWMRLFPDRPLRCIRCEVFDKALERVDAKEAAMYCDYNNSLKKDDDWKGGSE